MAALCFAPRKRVDVLRQDVPWRVPLPSCSDSISLWVSGRSSPSGKVAQLDGSHPDANQFLDEITQRLEHAAHFAFAPFVHFDLHPSIFLKFLYHARARWRGHAVFQTYAFAQAGKIVWRWTSAELHSDKLFLRRSADA